MTSHPAATANRPCPKCSIPMRTTKRNGIHVESCPDCRGIFLDRGELDRLLDLEAATIGVAKLRHSSDSGEPWPGDPGERRARRSE